MTDEKKPCEECSECDGYHHWMEAIERTSEPACVFQCKHCDAETPAIECAACDRIVPQAGAIGVKEPGQPTVYTCASCFFEDDDEADPDWEREAPEGEWP